MCVCWLLILFFLSFLSLFKFFYWVFLQVSFLSFFLLSFFFQIDILFFVLPRLSWSAERIQKVEHQDFFSIFSPFSFFVFILFYTFLYLQYLQMLLSLLWTPCRHYTEEHNVSGSRSSFSNKDVNSNTWINL